MFENNEENRNEYEYHYNYQPTQPVPPTTPPIDVQPKQPSKKRRWPRIAAIVLCASLALSITFGAGWCLNGRIGEGKNSNAQITVSDRQPVEVQTVSVTGSKKLTYEEIYDANVDSCVSIDVVSSAGYNFFGQPVMNSSSGSGFIITDTGYIVTNYHVIDGGETAQVTLNNGTTYDAQIVGGDSDYDVAVLKIEPQDGETFKPVVIDASGSLVVGDEIMTIGNPLGELTFSLSDGRVSCLDREINLDGTPFNMIQITAPINHGNSGGPLFDLYGEVVGIVTAKSGNSSGDTSVEGLGFAIPIEDVMDLITDIMENGQVTSHAWLGIKGTDVARYPNTGVSAGAYIAEVTENGPAEAAGLQEGDVITMLGTTQISSFTDLQSAVGSKSYRAGDTATVTYVRDGKVYTTELTFGSTTDMPEEEQETQQDQETRSKNTRQPVGEDSSYNGNMEDFLNRFFGYGF